MKFISALTLAAVASARPRRLHAEIGEAPKSEDVEQTMTDITWNKEVDTKRDMENYVFMDLEPIKDLTITGKIMTKTDSEGNNTFYTIV